MHILPGPDRSQIQTGAATDWPLRHGFSAPLGRRVAPRDSPKRAGVALAGPFAPRVDGADLGSQTPLSRRVLSAALGLCAGLVGTIGLDPTHIELADPMSARLALLILSAGLGVLAGGRIGNPARDASVQGADPHSAKPGNAERVQFGGRCLNDSL